MNIKKIYRSLLGIIIASVIGLGSTISASAWMVAPGNSLNLSMNLVGMANLMGLQTDPYVCNYTGVSSGTIDGTMKVAYKYSTGTSASKNWICQVGDGPYDSATLAQDFGASNVHTAATNDTDCMVYMLYDLGDPDSTTVKNNMNQLGITSIDEYYKLMSDQAIITINALPGGGSAHEDAISCYYRFSKDWRSLFSSNNGSKVSRETMLDYGIACPNENNYFFETYESQKFIDGTDAFPGVYDEINDGLITHDNYFASPVWEDKNEDASWNVINPVPSCSIYSRLSTNFNKDTDYTTANNLKTQATIENHGTGYTTGEWYGFTNSDLNVNGVSINDSIIAKNWEWTTHDYIGGVDSKTGGYSYNTASKSHLGYGEYCPSGVVSTHDWYIPDDQVTTSGRFMTVIVRETGTLCGLDGFGHWHGVNVTGIPVSNVTTVNTELKDDAVVIDYGLPVDFRIDENDRVWSNGSGSPIYSNLALTNSNPDDLTGYTGYQSNGNYGKLNITQADYNSCFVRYTPLNIMNGIDRFYYKVEKPDELEGGGDDYSTASITCIPATVMYYEDNFSASDVSGGTNASFVYNGSWSSVDNSDSTIAPSDSNILSVTQSGDNVVYGYDEVYNSGINYSLGSAHVSGAKNDSLSFTFKGTGFDVIMRTQANDGYVSYVVTQYAINSDGSIGSAVKTYNRRTLNCKNNNSTTLYQLPVCSERYGEYAYYAVELISAVSKPIYIDGFRIYDPLGIYGELGSQNDIMDSYYDEVEKVIEKASVYNLLKDGSTINDIGSLGIINNWNERYGTLDEDGNTAAFDTYVKTGPYNEIYLAPGQGVYFNIANADVGNMFIQTEAKAINGTTTQMTVAVDGVTDSERVYQMDTATSMYYVYSLDDIGMTSSEGTVTIMNTGNGYLSLSNMKFSKVLGTAGSINYTFIDEDGNRVEGCTISMNGTDVVSGADGKASFTGLSLDKYTVTLSTDIPDGYQFAPSMSYSKDYTVDADHVTINTQVILYHMGTAIYSFVDAEGNPFPGVKVTLNGTTVTTGADGVAHFDNLPFGSYTLHVETPDGYAMIQDSTVTVAPETLDLADTFSVLYCNLDIGSNERVTVSPSVTLTSNTVTFNNIMTETTNGSWYVSMPFDGVAGGSGYVSNKAYIQGTLYVTADVGSSTLNYYLSGFCKRDGNTYTNVSGTITNSTTASVDSLTIDMNTLLKSLCGNKDKFKDLTHTMCPDGYDFGLTAYELANLVGSYGNTAKIEVGGSEYPKDIYDKGSVTYTYVYENGTPASGMTVTLGDKTAVTDLNGSVTFSKIYLGNTLTLNAVPPSGYSTPKHTFTFDENQYIYNGTETVYVIDYTPGSNPSLTDAPYATIDGSTFAMHNITPKTEPGSYAVTFTLDGVAGSSGYYSSKYYVSGTITLYVDTDSDTIYYTSTLGGKINNKDFNKNHGTQTGSFTNTVTTFSGNDLIISFNKLYNSLTGNTTLYDNAEGFMPDGLQFTVAAYESTSMTGDSASATLTAIDDSVNSSGNTNNSGSVIDDDKITSGDETSNAGESQTTPPTGEDIQSSLQSIISNIINYILSVLKSVMNYIFTLSM